MKISVFGSFTPRLAPIAKRRMLTETVMMLFVLEVLMAMINMGVMRANPAQEAYIILARLSTNGETSRRISPLS
jgi:hypothetical protein